jgi:hypothetical protein
MSSKIEFFSGEKKSSQMKFDIYRHSRNKRGKLSNEKNSLKIFKETFARNKIAQNWKRCEKIEVSLKIRIKLKLSSAKILDEVLSLVTTEKTRTRLSKVRIGA